MFTDMALMLRSTGGEEVKSGEEKTKLLPDFQGRKPIHVSAGYGQVSFVQQLLEVIHLTQILVLRQVLFFARGSKNSPATRPVYHVSDSWPETIVQPLGSFTIISSLLEVQTKILPLGPFTMLSSLLAVQTIALPLGPFTMLSSLFGVQTIALSGAH